MQPLAPFQTAEPMELPFRFRRFVPLNDRKRARIPLKDSDFVGHVPMTFEKFRRLVIRHKPAVAAMKSHSEQTRAATKAWKRERKQRERWCKLRGFISNYGQFRTQNKVYYKTLHRFDNLNAVWHAYKQTWEAIAGIPLLKNTPAGAPGSSASSAPAADRVDPDEP